MWIIQLEFTFILRYNEEVDNNLKTLKNKAEKEIKQAQNLKDLDGVFRMYLGRKGELTAILRSLKNIPSKKRAVLGKEANTVREVLQQAFDGRQKELGWDTAKGEGGWIDVTAPGQKIQTGHLHPITQTRRKVEEIFGSMGFVVADGPEVEDEWHNFDALNIPAGHPARDLWDTFWLKAERDKKPLLLRTHTSPVQIRYMQENSPPIRIIVPGRTFRYEATDASHEINFYQVEGLVLDENISVANFKAVIQEFFKRFFETDVTIRLRPSYFPFTEPSFEVDISCVLCGGKGCSSCGHSGWLEMLGAGMVHPNVLKAVGYKQKNICGFAFGMGLDRLAMMKYKIPDVRMFFASDLRFLQQF